MPRFEQNIYKAPEREISEQTEKNYLKKVNLDRVNQKLKVKSLHYVFLLFILLISYTSSSKEIQVLEIKLPELLYIDAESGLRLRKEPTLTAEKIDVIPYGTQVIDLAHSSEIEEIDNIKSYWHLIKYRDLEGWGFGGYLSSKPHMLFQTLPLKDYAFDVSSLEDYIVLLGWLDALDLFSLDIAIDYCERYSKTMKKEKRDALFFILMEYCTGFTNNLSQHMFRKKSSIHKNKISTKIHKLFVAGRVKSNDWVVLNDSMKKSGVLLRYSEGMPYFYVDMLYLKNKFMPYLSESMQKYLELKRIEAEKPSCEDASLIIELSDLSSRLFDIDEFITNNPDFIGKDDLLVLYREYMFVLLGNLDNYSAFSGLNKKLNEDFQKEYESIITNNSDTNTAKIVKKFYELIKQNNYQKPKKLNSLFNLQTEINKSFTAKTQ
ncbi:MAG: SH3 domain-containing protein [Spirochaetes bacterium]|nr:SH3 domain-containing protein [Spirochaetota bacterium]